MRLDRDNAPYPGILRILRPSPYTERGRKIRPLRLRRLGMVREKFHLFPLLTLLFLSAMLVQAQPNEGNGQVIFGNPQGTDVIRSSPTDCWDSLCIQINEWLYPSLFAVDAQTGLIIPAAEDNFGLVIDPTPQYEAIQRITLRDDLTWSDGTPITAYDVLFSLLAHYYLSPYQVGISREVAGVRVLDTHTLAIEMRSPGCASFPWLNFPVIPHHISDPGFSSYVEWVNGEESGEVVALVDWSDKYRRNHYGNASSARLPKVTAGAFRFDVARPGESFHLTSTTSDLVVSYVNLEAGMNEVETFLQGKTNVLFNPPYNRRNDLRAMPELRIVEYPNGFSDHLVFNFADPHKPRSVRDDAGELRDQGQHPLFADPAVRRALQMAIDVDEIIRVVFEGNAQPLTAWLPPDSWAHNADITPVSYDLGEARRILERAGWTGSPGQTRFCRDCATAAPGTSLTFTLRYEGDGNRERVATMIANQLFRAGFSVGLEQSGPQDQRFDVFLGASGTPVSGDPHRSFPFTREEDLLNQRLNIGSYYNPDVDRLLAEAHDLPSCSVDGRAAKYHEVQSILQADVAAFSLYVRTDMAVAQPDVVGFAPLSQRPFWNIQDWLVAP